MLDVLSVSRHSRYFNQTRSHHIFQRVRLITLLLAVLQTAWVLVDQLLLPAAVQNPIAAGRVASSVALIALLAWYGQPYNLKFSLARLALLILILSGFQTYSQVVLLQAGYEHAVAGYQFFPFMIVAMQAIFPLTIVEVIVITATVTLIELATQVVAGQFGGVAEINDLWLLLVLAVIAGWASVNQLSMLLGLYRQATRDALTGLANRRQVMEHLEGDVDLCRRERRPLSVLLFDLDKFKSFNDNHGHAAGDIVLKQFAKILRQQTQPKGKSGQGNLAGRFGGEEFLVILPGAGPDAAAEMAEQIGAACHLSPVRIPSGEQVGFTTSIGVATLADGETPSDLLRRADEALYEAKAQGRDRYVVAAEAPADSASVASGDETDQSEAVVAG
jgi:diguanylate cyclase (GGDEF)-like protein